MEDKPRGKVFRIRSAYVHLKTWISAALVSVEEAVSRTRVSYPLAFEKRGHQQTTPTQIIRGSGLIVKNDCNTDSWSRQ
jgi:hypothetical protein